MTSVPGTDKSVTVDVTVLGENDETSLHTLVFSPASQFDVVDVVGMTENEEVARFPVPEMPIVGITGTIESTGDAGQTADDLNRITGEIENRLQ